MLAMMMRNLERRQIRSCLKRPVSTFHLNRSSGLCEFFVFNFRGGNKFLHRVTEQVRVFTVVEAPSHFVKVSGKMLCTNFMPRSNDAALKQRERRLYGIRVNVAVHVNLIK